MSQSSHKSLIHILLCWITILTIVQAVFVILFFTAGHFGWDSGSAKQVQGKNQHPPPPGTGDFSDKAKMFTYKADGVKNGIISWYPEDAKEESNDAAQSEIKIKKDGYYFMCLRITLQQCTRSVSNVSELDQVSLVKDNESILVGWINDKTNSTGLLCKMDALSVGGSLKVNITNKFCKSIAINDSLSVTYLEAIFMPKFVP